MLFYILLALGAALTALVFVLAPSLSLWWAIPIALGMIVLLNGLYLLAVWIYCKSIDMDREYDTIDPVAHRWTMTFIRWLLAVCRVKIRTVNLDIVPREGEFLLVGNHRSAFDPLTTFVAMKDWPLAFISKPENIYKLFLGPAPYKCCFLPIDRENPRNAIKTVKRASKLITDDVASVAVYPEGTRNYGKGLLPFHNAMFKIAQKANVPVVVMTVKGTFEIQKNFPLHKSVVNMDVVGVIPVETVKSFKTNELGDMAAEMMTKRLKELEGV